MAIPNCLVDEYNYDLGCLAPAILIIAVLSFMKKRVRLKSDLWNGRPGLPVPIDFLGDERNRFIIPFAFGATAASCLRMFFEISAASRDLKRSSWAKVLRRFLMPLLYGIINSPYLACLNAEYKIIGYAMGLIYSFIRFVVYLFLYLGCTLNEQDKKKFKNMEYVEYIGFLVNIPVVVCTLILIGSYSILLYKEIKKLNVQGLLNFWGLFQKEQDTTINLAGKTERAHVDLLFSNQLHKAGKRASNQNSTRCNSLKNWIYITRPDFKFSTQFLSSFLVSCLFVYQLTAQLLMNISIVFSPTRNQKPQSKGNASPWNVLFVAFQRLEGYLTASVVLASLFAILQLCFFLRSHRNDVLKTYRTRKGLLPDETALSPKTLVGKSLRFCGYQVAFTAIGFLINVLSVFLLLLPIYILSLLSKFKSTEWTLFWIRESFLDMLPYIITPILVWISMTLLSLFVFEDRTYSDISITVNNRRLFGIMSYFLFFFNILVGLWSGLLRIVKGVVMGLVFLPRIDRTSMMTGFRRFDRAYMAYIGFLCVLVAFRHPVMLCFCQLLLEGVRRRETGQSIASRPRVSGKALNRWFLAVMLVRNPSLVRYRKQDVSPASTSAVQLKISPSFLEDNLTQPERLQLVTEEKIEMDHVRPGTKHT